MKTFLTLLLITLSYVTFSQELACVVIEKKYGYIDREGTLVIPDTFIKALDFSEDLAGGTSIPREKL